MWTQLLSVHFISLLRPKKCSVTNQAKKHTILRSHEDEHFCIDTETDFRVEPDLQSDFEERQKYSFRTFAWSGNGKEELSIDCEIEVSIDPFSKSNFEIC